MSPPSTDLNFLQSKETPAFPLLLFVDLAVADACECTVNLATVCTFATILTGTGPTANTNWNMVSGPNPNSGSSPPPAAAKLISTLPSIPGLEKLKIGRAHV